MLDIYTVSFFGHRYIPNMFSLEDKLMSILRDIINKKEYVEFLVGRDGEFDQLAAINVKKAIQDYGYGNASLTLVLPYDRAEYRDNKESFEEYYDEVQICGESINAYPKAAIGIRNRDMVDRSDLIICYIEHENGGAYNAVKYAKQEGKKIINLYDINQPK